MYVHSSFVVVVVVVIVYCLFNVDGGVVLDDLKAFSSIVLPKYFKHNNFNSFVRQLHTYGFHKIESTEGICFQHENFRFGFPELLKNIKRKKPGSSLVAGKEAKGAANLSPPSSPECAATTEKGNASFLFSEIEKLKERQNACIEAIDGLKKFADESKSRDVFIFQKLQEISDFLAANLYLQQQQQQQQQSQNPYFQFGVGSEFIPQWQVPTIQPSMLQQQQQQQHQHQQVQLTPQMTATSCESSLDNDDNNKT